MRVIAVCAVALLLTGCTWVQKEIGAPAVPPAPPATPAPTKPSHRPVPPKPAPPQTQSSAPAAVRPDYAGRCHDMAANRALDAKQLGASAADQARMESDTYRDCMAQSVKP